MQKLKLITRVTIGLTLIIYLIINTQLPTIPLEKQLVLTESERTAINQYLNMFYSVKISERENFEKVAAILQEDLLEKAKKTIALAGLPSEICEKQAKATIAPNTKDVSSKFKLAVFLDLNYKFQNAVKLYSKAETRNFGYDTLFAFHRISYTIDPKGAAELSRILDRCSNKYMIKHATFIYDALYKDISSSLKL